MSMNPDICLSWKGIQMTNDTKTARPWAIQWLLDHGHKALIWLQFIVGALTWIALDPDPVKLLEALQSCMS